MKLKTTKKLFPLLSLLSGILCIVCAISLTFVHGLSVGNDVTFLAGVFFIILYFVHPMLSRREKRILNVLLGVWTVFMGFLFAIIAINGAKNTTTFDEDCVLVLGCGLRGNVPMPALCMRLDKCLEYLQHNPNAIIVVSGGQGHSETISSAEAMKNYLVERGVNPSQILEENQSSNTVEDMEFSKPIMDKYFGSKTYKVVCITSNHHAYRAGILARKFGIPVSQYNADLLWYLYPVAYGREALSICKMWLGYK